MERKYGNLKQKLITIPFSFPEEQYKTQISILANMPSSGGMGNSNMRKDNRDRNDRSMSGPRGGSMSGSGFNNSNKLGSRGNYQDNDGWIQTGNKNRGGNNSSQQFDPSKFRTTSVSSDFRVPFFSFSSRFWSFVCLSFS